MKTMRRAKSPKALNELAALQVEIDSFLDLATGRHDAERVIAAVTTRQEADCLSPPEAGPARPPLVKGPRGAAAATKSDGRDPATGRFRKGWRGGPGGDPHARQAARFREILFLAVSEHDFIRIAARLVTMAVAGDLNAIRLLLGYLIGPPGASRADPGEGPPATS